MPLDVSSFVKCGTQMKSLRAVERATYSASVVKSMTILCILEDHGMGQFVCIMTHPVQLRQEEGSWAFASEKVPAKSASTGHSKPFEMSGVIVMPSSFVRLRQRTIRFAATSWLLFGSMENREHWCVANCMSGRVEDVRQLSWPIEERQWKAS